MSELSPQEQAIYEEVRLAPYDPSWPVLFSREQERLLLVFPQFLAVEHIGSTAVQGLSAKPIIDILAGLPSIAAADTLFERILACGYTTSREFNAELTDRRWFMRSADGHRTHHLHVVVHLGPVWQEWLRFRNLLRQNPRLTQSYLKLKSELAVHFRQDREAYTHERQSSSPLRWQAPDPFIEPT